MPRAERLSRLPGLTFETDLDQKTFVVIGAAFTFDAIDGSTCAGGLEPLLQRGFIVAQRGAGAQLEGQLLGGLAEDLAVGQRRAPARDRHRER